MDFQYCTNIWKYNVLLWRNPDYNNYMNMKKVLEELKSKTVNLFVKLDAESDLRKSKNKHCIMNKYCTEHFYYLFDCESRKIKSVPRYYDSKLMHLFRFCDIDWNYTKERRIHHYRPSPIGRNWRIRTYW